MSRIEVIACRLSVCVCLCLALARTAASAEQLADQALQHFRQGHAEQARLLLAHCDQQLPQIRWLQLRMCIDRQDWDAAGTLIKSWDLNQLQPQPWRGALALALGEYYFHNQSLEQSRVWLHRALRAGGGQDYDDAGTLFYLLKVAFAQERHDDAQRYARLLWHTWPEADCHSRAGLIYAQLLCERDPAESRRVFTQLRHKKELPPDLYLRATEQLIRHLLPDEAVHAERIAGEALQRLQDHETGNLPAWQAIACALHDPRRGRRLLAALDQDQYPKLERWFTRFEESLPALHVRLAEARHLVQDGDGDGALHLLADDYRHSAAALAVALEAGLSLHKALQGPWQENSALCLRIAVLIDGDDARLRTVADRALQQLFARVAWQAADISLFLFLHERELATSAQVERGLQHCARFERRHAALGMYYCRLAKDLDAGAAAEARRCWRLALRFLPLSHDWFAAAAERLALLSLRPLPAGRVLRDASELERARLEDLVQLLSAAAWQAENDAQHRCRYLLGQALAQLGRPGEAAVCFKSLMTYATGERKAKLLKALRYLSEAADVAGPLQLPAASE